MKNFNAAMQQNAAKISFQNKIQKEKLPGSVVVTIDELAVVDTTKIENFIRQFWRTLENFTILHDKIKPDSKKDLFLYSFSTDVPFQNDHHYRPPFTTMEI